jgi:hypothetical protein
MVSQRPVMSPDGHDSDDGKHREAHRELTPASSVMGGRDEPAAVRARKLIGGDKITSEALHREAADWRS